jgi:hypothetical protein
LRLDELEKRLANQDQNQVWSLGIYGLDKGIKHYVPGTHGRQWFPELSRVDTPPNTLCIDPLNPDIGELAGAFGLSLDYISPGEKTRNYPGPVACYEPGYDSWTPNTLYSDVCP